MEVAEHTFKHANDLHHLQSKHDDSLRALEQKKPCF